MMVMMITLGCKEFSLSHMFESVGDKFLLKYIGCLF